MAVSRKRKHSIDQETSSIQHDIRSFAKVRKVRESREKAQKREQTPPPPSAAIVKTDGKRKRGQETDRQDDGELSHSPNATASKRVKKCPESHDTPSKKAAALFDRLELQNKIRPVPFPLNATKPAKETPELDALSQMNAAFLSAMSLYYAHNGSSSPADVNMLLPMVTKHWKKRTVTLDDLRVILSIGYGDAETFALQDYGKAGLCLSKQQQRGRAIKRATGYVDEAELQSRFRESLSKRWDQWCSSVALDENHNFTRFLDQMPRAEIIPHKSVESAAPMFARGHQRLADLKASQAAACADSAAPAKPANETHIASAQPQSRGSSLLDRVLAKQALTASLPAGPTKTQLERKAALHRIGDIARVLDLLANGRPRCSFSLQATVQQLQQSLRNPISKEEVQVCLDLMTKEITPGFVNVVHNGNVTCVVITKGGKIGLDEIRRRVEAALA